MKSALRMTQAAHLFLISNFQFLLFTPLVVRG